MQEFFLQHYVGHHPNVDFSDRISYHDVRWRFTPQNCAFRSAWNSLEALKTWWYTTLYQLPATANISLSLSCCRPIHSVWTQNSNGIQSNHVSFRFFLFQAFPWTLRSKGGETQLQKQNSQKTPGHKCSERGDDLKPWIIPTRWWQLKYFLFSPRTLGKWFPFWA